MPIIPTPGRREAERGHSASATLRPCLKQTKKVTQARRKKLLLAVTLGSNLLHLLLLNKSGTSWACDQVRCRLPSAPYIGWLHAAPVSPQTGSLQEHLLLWQATYSIFIYYMCLKIIPHFWIPTPVGFEIKKKKADNYFCKRRERCKGNCSLLYNKKNTKQES